MLSKIIIVILLVLLLSLLICVNSNKDIKSKNDRQSNTIAESELKHNQILELASKSKTNVIKLDDETYNHYAVKKPRSYSLIVFLTASSSKFKCTICKQVEKEFSIVAKAYASEVKASGSIPQVFFIKLDYETSHETFKKYGFTNVPVIFYISTNHGERKGSEYHILIRDKYHISSADVDAESISNFVGGRINMSIPIKRSMIGSYFMLIFIFGVIALLVKPIINSLDFWLSLVQSKYLWAFISGAIYTCSISGVVFDIIRSPQSYYANPQTGQIMFFYPQSGNQFVVEGFIIGFLNILCGIALIFMTVVAPRLGGSDSKRSSFLIGAMAVALVTFLSVKSLYKYKNRWYGSGM